MAGICSREARSSSTYSSRGFDNTRGLYMGFKDRDLKSGVRGRTNGPASKKVQQPLPGDNGMEAAVWLFF